jgi:hypothetical protein
MPSPVKHNQTIAHDKRQSEFTHFPTASPDDGGIIDNRDGCQPAGCTLQGAYFRDREPWI